MTATMTTITTTTTVPALPKARRNIVAAIAHVRWIGSGLSALALCACSALSPSATPPPAFYALNGAPGAMLTPASPNPASPNPASTNPASPNPAFAAQPTLIVNPPRAAAGFDSQRIIYLREAHKLEYFAKDRKAHV